MVAHRELFAVGKVEGQEVRLARRCGWCRRFNSIADMFAAYGGALVSDGMCKSCARKFEAGVDSVRPPENAA